MSEQSPSPITEAAPRQQVSRRTIAKGVAWSVPAVMVAGIAPAHAASRIPPLRFVGDGCKDPSGGSGSRYYFALHVDAGVSTASIPFTFDWSEAAGMVHQGQNPGTSTVNTINITQSPTDQIIILKFSNPNSAANGTLTITYTLNGVQYSPSTTGTFSADCDNRVPPIIPFNTPAGNGSRTSESSDTATPSSTASSEPTGSSTATSEPTGTSTATSEPTGTSTATSEPTGSSTATSTPTEN